MGISEGGRMNHYRWRILFYFFTAPDYQKAWPSGLASSPEAP
jgi:hypothetical protein